MSKSSRKVTRLELGGIPRVNLLPPEVAQAAKARSLHGGLSLLVVAVMVLVGAGYGVASLNAGAVQQSLNAANQRTTQLLKQQQKYVEVRKVTKELALATAARQVGASTEINWRSYLKSIQASLPSGTVIATFTARSSSPLAEFAQPTVPLQGQRIAELNFSATSESLPDVQAWLNALSKLKGFVDATPGTVTLASGGTYTATIIMHINEQALSNRFSKDVKKDAVSNTDTTADAAPDAGNDGDK